MPMMYVQEYYEGKTYNRQKMSPWKWLLRVLPIVLRVMGVGL